MSGGVIPSRAAGAVPVWNEVPLNDRLKQPLGKVPLREDSLAKTREVESRVGEAPGEAEAKWMVGKPPVM